MQTRPQPRSASVPCGRPAERDGGGSRGRCPGSKGLAVPMHRRALSPSLSAAPASRLSDLLLLLTRLVLVIFAAGGAVQPGTAPPPWLTSPARTTGSRRCKARSRSGFATGARRRGFARRPRSMNDRCRSGALHQGTQRVQVGNHCPAVVVELLLAHCLAVGGSVTGQAASSFTRQVRGRPGLHGQAGQDRHPRDGRDDRVRSPAASS